MVWNVRHDPQGEVYQDKSEVLNLDLKDSLSLRAPCDWCAISIQGESTLTLRILCSQGVGPCYGSNGLNKGLEGNSRVLMGLGRMHEVDLERRPGLDWAQAHLHYSARARPPCLWPMEAESFQGQRWELCAHWNMLGLCVWRWVGELTDGWLLSKCSEQNQWGDIWSELYFKHLILDGCRTGYSALIFIPWTGAWREGGSGCEGEPESRNPLEPQDQLEPKTHDLKVSWCPSSRLHLLQAQTEGGPSRDWQSWDQAAACRNKVNQWGITGIYEATS